MPIDTEQSKANSSGQVQKHRHIKWSEADNSLADVKKTFGFVPGFMNNFTDQSLPGAWAEAQYVRFGTETALDTKTKSLIALGIAAQIPCDRIGYFEEKASLANGATRNEQLEAVLMAGITRHWSTVLHGSLLDKKEFRKEVDKVMYNVKKMMLETANKTPPEEMFLKKPTTADETYKDIEQTLGLVPKFFLLFPKDAIAGAWSEFKGLQLNPYTELGGKQKELLGLAVAAQIPCEYCIYFHSSAAALNGATELEIQEAIAVAATVRHWSTVFHGPNIDMVSFKKDADQILQNVGQRRLQS